MSASLKAYEKSFGEAKFPDWTVDLSYGKATDFTFKELDLAAKKEVHTKVNKMGLYFRLPNTK
jgi:hypothetical protein